MEKNKTLKARVLALALSVLMIVGVLPMSVFALTGEVDNENGDKLTADYVTPSVGKLIKDAYKADSKYWTKVVSTSDASSYYGYTGRSYIAGGGMANSYYQLDPVGGTIPVSETGNVIHFPKNAEKVNASWSSNAYNSMITFNGIRVGGSTAVGTAKGGLAGIDFVFTGDFLLKEDSAAGSAGLWYCPLDNATTIAAIELLTFVSDGEGNFKLCLGARSGYSTIGVNGTVLCTLPADEYFTLSVIFDVGGEQNVGGNEFYVLVNGEYVGGANILNSTAYNNFYNTLNAQAATVEGGFPTGLMLTSLSLNSGAVYYDLKDSGVYFYDDTPDDGDYTNVTRGQNVGVFFNNDFEFENYAVGSALSNTTFSYGAFKSTASFATGKVPEGGTASSFVIVEDANGNKAMQPNITSPDSYFDIWAAQTSWSVLPQNSGRSFVLSADVKGSGLTVALFGLTDRAGASPSPVVLGNDGTLRLNYTEGVGANTSIPALNTMPVLAELSDDEYTRVALAVNVPENYFVVYVDGEQVTEKLIFLSTELLATVNNHTTTPAEGEPYKTFPNGFALSGARMHYSGGTTNKTWTYDNILCYWGDEYKISTLPYGENFVTPNGDDIAAKVGAENIALFTDFDSATAASDGAYKASASYRTNKYGFHHNGALTQLIDDGNGGKAMLYHNGANTNLNYYLTSGFRTYPDADTVGKSFVVSADIKAGEKMTDGQLLAFTSYAQTNNNTYNYTAIAVFVKADGTIYAPDASNGIVTILNGWRGNSYASAIGKLSKDEFTNVAVQVNPGENWFRIYINGEAKTDKLLLANADTLAAYEAANAEVLSGKGYNPTSFSFGYRGAADPITHYYVWDNMAFYYADNLVTKYVPNLGEGEIKSEIIGNAPVWTAPDGDDIRTALGDSALLYYNNFNSYTDGLTAWTTYTTGHAGVGSIIPGGSGNTIAAIDDGNGGLAMQYKGGVQMTFAWNYGSRNAQNTALSGKSFTFSSDFKLGEDIKQGNLICFQSSVQGASGAVHFTAIPVWVDAAGNLYNGQVTTPTSAGGVTVTAGTLWKQNGINVQGNAFQTAANKIGALSADKYTNVAVSVDVANNVYNIYIDGVCVAANQTFACENVLAQYEAVDMENGTLDYANGFGLTAVSLGYRDPTTADKTSIIFDNWAIYESAELIGWSEDTREVVYDFSGANDGYIFADGLGLNEDYLYYFLNGEAVVNGASCDGILTTDEKGRVMLGDEYVTDMLDVYHEVNGDLLPVDGVYTGLYQANKLLGINYASNLYYYNEEGNLVTNSACTVINGIPYVIGSDAMIDVYTGICENKYYVNSVVQVNGLQYVGEDIYYAGADGTLQTGTYKIDGVYYEFDAETYKGTVKEAGEVVDNVANATTGKVYESVADALEEASNGDKVTVSEDVTIAEDITIGSKVTLDLNGKTVTANGIVTIFNGSGIVDNGAEKGLLKAEKTDVLYTGDKTADSIILYNEAKEGYQVAKVKKQDSFTADETGDGFVLMFRPSLDSNTAYNMEMFAGMDADDDIQFILQLRTSDGTAIRTFVLDSDYVAGAYADNKAMKITVRGAKHNYAGQELTVYYMLYSRTTGMECQMYAGSITPTADTPAEAE